MTTQPEATDNPSANRSADAAPPAASASVVELLRRLTQSAPFRNIVLAAILLASFVVGLETYPGIMAEWGPVLLAIDHTLIWLFVVEILLRIGAEGRRPWRFFTDPWNVFDFIVVAICILPMEGHYAAVLRLARVLRVFRLFSALPRLQIIVNGLLHAIPSIGYVALLMFLLFYVYAVIGTGLFSANDPLHFGTLHASMLSLFRVVTLEDWTDLMYIQMFGSDNYRIEGLAGAGDVARQPQAQPFVGALYFVSFVLFGTMIVLNLLIGVVISAMSEAQTEQARKLLPQSDDEAANLEARLVELESQADKMRELLQDVRERIRRQ